MTVNQISLVEVYLELRQTSIMETFSPIFLSQILDMVLKLPLLVAALVFQKQPPEVF